MPLTTSDISDMTTKDPYQNPNPNMMNVRSQTPQRTLAMLTVQLIQVPVTLVKLLVTHNADTTIPSDVLLNTSCNVLQRTHYRIARSKPSSLFSQNIVASSPGNSIPLDYHDALFPTHYYDNKLTK